MMKKLKKEQVHGLVGTIIVHTIILLILLLIVISKPPVQEESGVPVIMGSTPKAKGDAYTYTEVKVAPQPSPKTTTPPAPVKSKEEPLVTQNREETVALKTEPKKKEEKVQPPKKTPEQEEKERKEREDEKRRQEAEEMARAANAKIAGAFGKGTTMANKGKSDDGVGNEGSTQGNADTGVTTGIGGYGTFDLKGRDIGPGGLPRPEYNVQDEGIVVVDITVNQDGRVTDAQTNPRTNTSNKTLRQAAISAAKKAVFNKVAGVNNQRGTITYKFNLK